MTQGAIYFDSSALVKLVVPEEDGADVAAAMLERDAARFTCMLSYPETRSALQRRHRNAELSQVQISAAQSDFTEIVARFNLIDVAREDFLRAADLVTRFSLSGADAVHLATALAMQVDSELTFLTWDRQAAAADSLGLTVQPTFD